MANSFSMDISATHLRALRAALFTALCVTLSAASHVLLSRMPLPVSTVALLAVGVFVIAYALAGRERDFGRIAALLVPLELAADTVFTVGQHTCYGQIGGPIAGPLRSMGVDLLCGGGSVGAPLAELAGVEPAPVATWLALLAAHVAVGLLAAAWLRRGETALVRLVGAITAFAFRPLLIAVAALTSAPAPRRPAVRSSGAAPPVRVLPLLVHSVVRRGPPSCSLAA